MRRGGRWGRVRGGLPEGHAGDGAGFAVAGDAAEERRSVVGGLSVEPGAVGVDDGVFGSEAAVEGSPAAVGEAVELVLGGVAVDLAGGVVEFGEEFVVGVDGLEGGARGESGGAAEGGPVAPAVVDDVPGDAGACAEVEEGEVGSVFGGEAAEFVEEVGGGEHG